MPVEAGTEKSHGACKRHYLEQLRSFGLDDMIPRYEQQPDETFPPDLGESTPPVADQVAKATGFTFSPKEQAGAISLSGLSPDETALLMRNVSWEFTDKRPDSPTVGFTFYVKANTPYEQIMQEYQQRLAKWKEDAAKAEKWKQDWDHKNPDFLRT